MASQSGPGGPCPTGARWRVPDRGVSAWRVRAGRSVLSPWPESVASFWRHSLRSTLHRAPVGQGPPGPGWLAISLGFWSGRALATGTARAGLCLIHHHQRRHSFRLRGSSPPSTAPCWCRHPGALRLQIESLRLVGHLALPILKKIIKIKGIGGWEFLSWAPSCGAALSPACAIALLLGSVHGSCLSSSFV